MRPGQRVVAARAIRSGRIIVAKGTVGTVARRYGLLSTKYSVKFASTGSRAVVSDVSERDLVPIVRPSRRGTKTRFS
jgi:hypothetical protein